MIYEKLIANMPNKKLAETSAEYARQLVGYINDEDSSINDCLRQTVYLLNEVSRRLSMDPHITFNDAQFDI